MDSIIPAVLQFFVLCFLLLSLFESFYCFFLWRTERIERVQEELIKLLIASSFLLQSIGAYFLFKTILPPGSPSACLLDDSFKSDRFFSDRGVQANWQTVILRII